MTNDLSNYEVHLLPMNLIYSDDGFNCRGRILPYDVMALANDIKVNNLQFPVSVQPAEDVKEGLPEPFEYRIVAGHRRHMAFKILKRDVIPAMVKRGLSEVMARVYNLSENLQRSELNIMQESRALEKLKNLGMKQEEAAAAIGRTRSWIQVRYNLLELPAVIQEEAAAGVINQQQIKQIYGLKRTSDNPEKILEAQFAAVRKIKNALLNGEKGISVAKPPKQDPFKKKRRQKNEIQDMIKHIGKEGPGFGLATRSLAWANGEINTAELFFDIKEACRKLGKPYNLSIIDHKTEIAEVVVPN